jgi:hypothetical protein
MKNAHPTILKYLCEKHDIPCPNLARYCADRESFISQIPDGKQVYLASINNMLLNSRIRNVAFKKFDVEVKMIQKALVRLPDYKEIVNTVPLDKKHNWNGSAINRIMCVIENDILAVMSKHCSQKNLPIYSYMFDGLMIYDDYYEDQDLIAQMEVDIETSTPGLNMRLSYKEHNTSLEMPDDYVIKSREPPKVKKGGSYDDVKKEFEESICKIINSGNFIKKVQDSTVMFSKATLIASYEHLKYDDIKTNKSGEQQVVECEFLKRWLKDGDMKCYEDVGVYPHDTICPTEIFNLWTPFAMEQIDEYEEKPDELQRFLEFLKILCGDCDLSCTYFQQWLAQMIQYPSTKSIFPTLISDEGAGKGTLLEFISGMLGKSKYYETTKPSEYVWGKFNGVMTDSFLVNLDELSKKESMEADGVIKGLITNPAMTINEKNTKPIQIKSIHRFIATTNKDEPVNTHSNDRRNWVLRSSDKLIGNKAYFTSLRLLLADKNVLKTIYEHLKSIEGMDKFGEIIKPMSEYQEELCELAKSPLELWTERIPDYYSNDVISLDMAQCVTCFQGFCTENAIKYDVSGLQLMVRLSRMKNPYITKGVKNGKKPMKTVFDLAGLRGTKSDV